MIAIPMHGKIVFIFRRRHCCNEVWSIVFRQKMVVAHELGHVLGFHHEQSRPDRDDFVIIIEDNMKEGTLRNFHIEQAINAHGIPYDYGSLMHYGQYVRSQCLDGEMLWFMGYLWR